MDLRRMYYFNAIVKYKSFSRAAKSLHISQPSLSNAIKTLEIEIDAPLIKVIIAYQKQYPQNQITLIDTLYNQTVHQALLGLNVHAVITNQHIVDQEIKSELLYTEPYVVLTRNDHPFATKEKITLVDFAEEALILGMPEFQTSAQILKAFEQENVMPHIQYKIERFEMIKVLVEEGLGIAILPQQYVTHHLSERLLTRPVNSEFLKRNVYLSTMKDRTFPESILKLFELIKTLH